MYDAGLEDFSVQFSKCKKGLHDAFNVVSFLNYCDPLGLVALGGKVHTWAQKEMISTSGHTIHLMPGDHTCDTPEIPFAAIWNRVNHYSPTYPTSPKNVLK